MNYGRRRGQLRANAEDGESTTNYIQLRVNDGGSTTPHLLLFLLLHLRPMNEPLTRELLINFDGNKTILIVVSLRFATRVRSTIFSIPAEFCWLLWQGVYQLSSLSSHMTSSSGGSVMTAGDYTDKWRIDSWERIPPRFGGR